MVVHDSYLINLASPKDDIHEKSMAAFEKLATRDKVAGVVGPYSSKCASALAKLAEKYKVPLLIPVAAKDDITRQNLKWTFRLSATTSDYATILLDMATKLGKPRSMAIISENTDFGTSGAKSAKEYAAKKGIAIVAEEAYAPGSPDYRSTLASIKSKKPDLVFVAWAGDGSDLTDAASAQTLAARLLPFVGNDQSDVPGATLVYKLGGFVVYEIAGDAAVAQSDEVKSEASR